MRFIMTIFLLVFSAKVAFSQSEIELEYETERGTFKVLVVSSSTRVEIVNKTEGKAPREIRGIKGLERLKYLERVEVNYFEYTKLENLVLPIRFIC